jgi:LysM repeat protein
MAIAAAGLLTFVVVYVALQLATRPPEVQPLVPVGSVRAADSLSPRIGAGLVALALPLSGAEPLIRDLRPGARLNVLANVTEPGKSRQLSAVVARGATVVEALSSTTPLLVEIEPADAVVLAHLMLGGARLSGIVWQGGVAPAEELPLDARSARALLGLPALATPTPEPTSTPPPTATPQPGPTSTALPVASPTPRPNGPVADRYVVQPGDSLASVASQLGVDLDRLRVANPNLSDTEPLPPGMQLVVPQ